MRLPTACRILLVAAALAVAFASPAAAEPRNVVLLIGDGMGFEHVRAAGLFAYGEEGQLFMEQLPATGRVTTHPAGGKAVPDSASAGTALAAGVKVSTGVVATRYPGDGEPLETILESYQKAGRRTGLVSSESIGGATPASFAAHTRSRKMYPEIYRWYYEKTRPNLMFGGGWQQPVEDAKRAGYHIIRTRREMEALDPARTPFVVGRFSPSDMPYEYDYTLRIDPRYDRVPHLSEMALAAVRFLDAPGKGFFLMVEGGSLDHAAHQHDIRRVIFETLEFDNAVKEVVRWAIDRNDTLVVVTADHECGGLKLEEPAGRGEWPEVSWSTPGHTRKDVPIYAWGVGAEKFAGALDNTDVPKRILELPETGQVKDREGRQSTKWLLTVRY